MQIIPERCQIHLKSSEKNEFYFSWWSLVRKCWERSCLVWWWSKPSTDTLSLGKTKSGSNPPLGGCRGETFIYLSTIKREFYQKLSFSPNPGSTYKIETCLWIALEWNQSWRTSLRWMGQICLLSSDFCSSSILWSLYLLFLFYPVSTCCNLL